MPSFDKLEIIEKFNLANRRVFYAFEEKKHPLPKAMVADTIAISFNVAINTKVSTSHIFLETDAYVIKARRKIFKSEYRYDFLAYHHLELIWRI